MDEFFGSGSDDGGGMSFAKLGKQEALRTLKAIQDVEELLHDYKTLNAAHEGDTNIASQNGDDDDLDKFRFMRYQSTGYNAHSESTDRVEVRFWQEAFPYLQVTGKSIGATCDDLSSFEASMVTSVAGNVPHTTQDYHCGPDDLCVEGHRMVIHTERLPTDCCNDTDIVDGTLDELIAIDNSKVEISNDGPNVQRQYMNSESTEMSIPLSPRACQREEIRSLLLDAVWPEVVEALRPLVRRIVEVSREKGIQYDEPVEQNGDKGNKLVGGWDDSDDDF